MKEHRIHKPEAGTVQEEQNFVAQQLRNRLQKYEGIEFKIYNELIYEKFLNDCDEVGQYAILKQAGTILFLDNKARGYGLLTHKLLPVLQLERAIQQHVAPHDILLPEVHFVRGYSAQWDTNDEELQQFMNGLAGESVVIFDESSRLRSAAIDRGGEISGRWDSKDIEAHHMPHALPANHRLFPKDKPSVLRIAEAWNTQCAPKQFYPFLGKGSYGGGLDLETRGSKGHFSVSKNYGIDMFPGSSGWNKPFAKTTKARGTSQHMQQLRDEHSKMAWELFKRVCDGKS